MKNRRGLERELYHLHRKYLKSAQYPCLDRRFAHIPCILDSSSFPRFHLGRDVLDSKIPRNATIHSLEQVFLFVFPPWRRTRKQFENNLSTFGNLKRSVSFLIRIVNFQFYRVVGKNIYIYIFINAFSSSTLVTRPNDDREIIARISHGSPCFENGDEKWEGVRERKRARKKERKKEKRDDASAEGRETYDEMHLGNSTI